MNTPTGLSYLSLLALSPASGNLGTLQLFWSSVTKASTRAWALLR
jgi:hypothetical protein